MRRRLDGIEAALSEAMQRVGVLYHSLPEHLRPDVTGERWLDLEDAIDGACGAGDRDAALLAIESWERHASEVLSRLLLSSRPFAGRAQTKKSERSDILSARGPNAAGSHSGPGFSRTLSPSLPENRGGPE